MLRPIIYSTILLILFNLINFLSIFSYEYELSLTGIFKNEAPYLKEWIEYHKLIGVQHFYLYNNNSEDNYLEVLEPYIENKEVKLIEWDFQHKGNLDWILIQCQAYEDAIKKAIFVSKWLAIFDIDEFCVPCECDLLTDFLKEYEEFGGICINWQIYGTSFIEKIPNNTLLIENLYLKANPFHERNRLVKSIVRPERVETILNPHTCIYKKGFFCVNSNKEKLNFLGIKFKTKTILLDKIRINHYWTRDEYYLNNYKLPRWQNREKMPSFIPLTKPELKEYENYNEIEDKIIYKYINPLKKAMGFN